MNKKVMTAIIKQAIDLDASGKAETYVNDSPLPSKVKAAALSLISAMNEKQDQQAKKTPLPRATATIEQPPAEPQERKQRLSERIFGTHSDT